MALSILVIDDEENIGWSFKQTLSEKGMDVRFTVNPEEGLMMLRYSPDIIFLDFKMPKINGIEALKRIKAENPEQIVIMMTGYANVENAVEAMQLGAFHYIQKPFQIDDIIPWIDRAREILELRQSLQLSKPQQDNDSDFGMLDGKSPVMRKVFKSAEKVAKSRSTSILITGESGTGKELLARSIHNLSERSKYQIVALNCSAIPELLLESELFGYEPGAFTGANKRKKGMFEIAEMGTMFLDEIGDMSLNLQSKLLRVLEYGTFTRIGGKDEIAVDVRIIAATNRQLEERIADGLFRDDLYYRLNIYSIEMPPLRDRGDDILELTKKFISKFNAELKKDIKGLTPEAARAIKSFNWPGNVRQLQNAMESAMIECESEHIDVHHLPSFIFKGSEVLAQNVAKGMMSSGTPTLDEVKRAYILMALGKFKTDQDAADALGISRRTISRLKNDITNT